MFHNYTIDMSCTDKSCNVIRKHPSANYARASATKSRIHLCIKNDSEQSRPTSFTKDAPKWHQFGQNSRQVPQIHSNTPYDSTLNLTVRAAAYAYEGNKKGDGELGIEAKEIYGRALVGLRGDSGKGEGALGGCPILAGVLVLGLYEVRRSSSCCIKSVVLLCFYSSSPRLIFSRCFQDEAQKMEICQVKLRTQQTC